MILVSRMLSGGGLHVLGITAYRQLNFLITMQLLVLPVSFVVLGAIYLYDRKNFRLFLRKGDVFAEAKPVRVLGLRKSTTWRTAGPVLTVVVAAATLAFTTSAVLQMKAVADTVVLRLFPFALFLALTNSWSEEIFGRFSVVAGLHARVRPIYIFWISATIFGIPHYFGGNPSGFSGVLMTGCLGWFLAKSVYETRGLFWAWFIHFVADVLIFTSQLMILVGSDAI